MRAGRRARHADRRPERPGRHLDPVVAVRADRGAVPAGRAHRRGQPVGQLRVVVHELRLRQRRRHQPGGLRRQRGHGRRHRLPRLLRRRPRDRRGAGLRRGHRRRSTRSSSEMRAVAERMPVVLVKGGATSGGAAGRGQPHRRRWPPTTASSTAMCRQAGRDPGRDDRGGLRGGGHLRHPARCRQGPNVCVVSARPAAGASSPPMPSPHRASSCSPLPDDLIAALDAELPPRWSRNNPIDMAGGETKDTIPNVLEIVARHPAVDARRPPRHGHPVEPGAHGARGPLLPGPRPRAHRRLPRPPGPSVHGDRGRRCRPSSASRS